MACCYYFQIILKSQNILCVAVHMIIIINFCYLSYEDCMTQSLGDLPKVKELIKSRPGLDLGAFDSKSHVLFYCSSILTPDLFFSYFLFVIPILPSGK